ncbi:MAG: hypothetical protein NXI24_18075 [bacterium]|nr:hypothetical protein [bacterium]
MSSSEASEPGQHPDPDHIGNALLEEQIDAKLANLSRDHRNYQTRVLRIDRNRLEIHARRRMTRRYQSAYYTPDQLAHQLTIELAAQSPAVAPDLARGLSQDILRSFSGRVDRFLLIPELALSDLHLLTHIYCSSRRLLAVYLYPRRFDRTNTPESVKKNQHRLEATAHAASGGGLGLLGSVIASISQSIPPTVPGAAGAAKSTLHKFIIPGDVVTESELTELQAIHDLYSEQADSGANSGDAL